MIHKILLFLFLLLFLVFPNSLSLPKYIILVALLITSLKYPFKNYKKIYGLIVWLIFVFFSFIIGLKNGFEIDKSLLLIYLGTPIGGILISNTFEKKEMFDYLNKILLIIFYIVIIVDVIILLDVFNLVKIFNSWFKYIGYSTSGIFMDDKVEMRIPNQTSLMFLIPYSIFREDKQSKLNKLMLVLSFIVTILSGRRALQIIVMLSLIFNFLKGKLNIKKVGIIFLTIFILVISLNKIGKILGVENIFASVKYTVERVFDKNIGSGRLRDIQRKDLFLTWTDVPLLGKGVNASSNNIIRSKRAVWSYEEVYLAFLMQGGILGFSLFWTIVLSGSLKLMKKSRMAIEYQQNYYKALLAGSLAFFLAASSNPMIYYIWFWSIFLISFNNNEKNKIEKKIKFGLGE